MGKPIQLLGHSIPFVFFAQEYNYIYLDHVLDDVHDAGLAAKEQLVNIQDNTPACRCYSQQGAAL